MTTRLLLLLLITRIDQRVFAQTTHADETLCNGLANPSVYKYGSCYFLSAHAGDCTVGTYTANQARCAAVHPNAILGVANDETHLKHIFDVLEPQRCGGSAWIEIGMRQTSGAPGLYDWFNWLLPNGALLPIAPSFLSARWGDSPGIAELRGYYRHSDYTFGDDVDSWGTLAICQFRSGVMHFDSLLGVEGTAETIDSDQDLSSSACAARCKQRWACVAYTHVTAPTRVCRLHTVQHNDPRHVQVANAYATYFYAL